MKFFRRGVSKIYFLPAVAAPGTGPTAPELAAGKNLSDRIAEVNGFQFSNSPISAPDLGTTYTTQVTGEDTVSDSSLVLYDDDTDTAVRTALAKGTAGFLVFAPYGATAAKRAEVWPAVSTGCNDEWTVGNDPARFSCAFAITSPPTQNAAMP